MPLGDMDFELFKKIIDEAALHLPVTLVIFFRGESLLHPEFFDMVKYAKEKGIGPIQLASNGLLVTDDIADKLIKSGIDYISFSLDTLDEEIYNNSRLTGDIIKSTENIVKLSKKCKELKKQGFDVPTLQVSTIDIDIYKNRQQEFIDFWREHVDFVRVYFEHDDKGQVVSPVGLKRLEHLENRKPCRKVFTDFLVFWNGEVTTCNYNWNPVKSLGNVKDNSIKDIWHSDEFNQIRDMHNNNSFPKDFICADCHHWKIDYTDTGYLGDQYTGNN
jgi:radical SAM protein with 4Fe4S-binding SPASM domain